MTHTTATHTVQRAYEIYTDPSARGLCRVAQLPAWRRQALALARYEDASREYQRMRHTTSVTA